MPIVNDWRWPELRKHFILSSGPPIKRLAPGRGLGSGAEATAVVQVATAPTTTLAADNNNDEWQPRNVLARESARVPNERKFGATWIVLDQHNSTPMWSSCVAACATLATGSYKRLDNADLVSRAYTSGELVGQPASQMLAHYSAH